MVAGGSRKTNVSHNICPRSDALYRIALTLAVSTSDGDFLMILQAIFGCAELDETTSTLKTWGWQAAQPERIGSEGFKIFEG